MLKNINRLQAVIFDMDGVLLLSTEGHRIAYEETLKGVGVTTFSYNAVAGMRTDEAFRKIFLELDLELPEEKLQTLVSEKRRRVLGILGGKINIAEYGAELIAELRTRYRLVLASSASPQTVELFLRECGFGDAFEFFLDGSAVSQAKPSPQIYQLVLERLKLKPIDCIVIEDAVSGVQASVRAGIPVIAVTGTEEPKELTKAGAIVVASGLKEVGRLLKR